MASLIPLADLRVALNELEATRQELDERIDQLRVLIASWENGELRKLPPKRDAVLALLRERPYRRMALSEIRSELIGRGQLADTRKASHALQMTMVTLYKEGLVERPTTGFYVLSRDGHTAEFPSYDKVVIPNRAEFGAEVATPDLQRKEGEA